MEVVIHSTGRKTVPVILESCDLIYVDEQRKDIQDQTGTNIGRSAVIRAFVTAIADRAVSLAACRCEHDITDAVKAHWSTK